MAFELPGLAYEYEALEPHIDAHARTRIEVRPVADGTPTASWRPIGVLRPAISLAPNSTQPLATIRSLISASSSCSFVATSLPGRWLNSCCHSPTSL